MNEPAETADPGTSHAPRVEVDPAPGVAIHLNGDPQSCPADTAVADLLRGMGLDPDPDTGSRGIAVALDGAIVPRKAWASTAVGDGARVEIIGAIGGG